LNVKIKNLKKKKIINHMFYKLLSKNQFYRKLRYIVKKSYKNNKYKINKILKIIRLIKIKKKLFKGIFLNEIFFSELNLFTKKNKKFKKIMNFHGVRNLLAKKTYTTYNYFFRSYISISKRKIKKYLAVGRDSKLKRFIFKNPFKSNETYLNNLKNNLVFKNKSISVNNSKDGIALINNFFLHKKKLFIKPVQINPFSKIIFKKKKFNFFNLIKNFIFKNIFFLLRWENVNTYAFKSSKIKRDFNFFSFKKSKSKSKLKKYRIKLLSSNKKKKHFFINLINKHENFFKKKSFKFVDVVKLYYIFSTLIFYENEFPNNLIKKIKIKKKQKTF